MPISLPERENRMPLFLHNSEGFCVDEDFVNAFVLAVPEKETQQKFLLNTKKYRLHEDYDPNYVLFFRRTLPSNTPKHEERWTNEYTVARMGLKIEIPHGPHRLHSIILCDSLGHILSNGEKDGETNSFSDGEIVVNFPDYDQNTCICKFKPSDEKEALNKYLQTDGAMNLKEILNLIQVKKKELYETLD